MKDLYFISTEDLNELLEWKSDDGILSIYLDIERDGAETQKWKALVKSEIGKASNLYGDDKNFAKAAAEAQNEILEMPVEMRKRSLIYFKDIKSDKMFSRSIQLPVNSGCTWSKTPYLRPLLGVIDRSPILGIVIISQEVARLLTWKQGLINESEEIRIQLETGTEEEEIPSGRGKGRLASAQADSLAQKVALQVKKSLSDLSKEVSKIAQKDNWQSILLIGASRFTNAVEEDLPAQWQEKVIGTLDKNYVNASIAQIADSTTDLLKTWRDKVDETLVKSAVETAQAGGRAVLGVQETLYSLEQYKVKHLLFSSNIKIEGWKDESGRIYADIKEENGENLQKEPHVVEKMIEMAFESGARVTPMEGKSAEMLKNEGGVAALVRY